MQSHPLTKRRRSTYLLFILSQIVLFLNSYGQCDSTNSPTFQIVTTPAFPAINGTCGVYINVTNLQSSAPGGVVSYSVYAPGQGPSPYPIPSVTLASATGVYSVVAWQVANSCITTKTLQITIPQAPTISVVPDKIPLCYGNTTTLTASGASTYIWHNGATSPSIVLTPFVPFTYTVKGFNSNGCGDNKIGNFTLQPAPVLNINVPQYTVCINQPAQFIASGASTYTWNLSSTGSLFTSAPFTSLGSISYTLLLLGTDSLGCSNLKSGFYSLQVDACDVGISKQEHSTPDILDIFPNPARDLVLIQSYGASAILDISIFDMTGREVLSKLVRMENQSAIVELNLANGSYTVKMTNAQGQIVVKKLIINR